MPTYNVSLDMNKSVQLVRPEVIVRVGEAETQKLRVTLYDDGLPYTPTGELRVQIKRRDGGLVITKPMTNESENIYICVLPAQTYTYHGETRLAYVAEYQGGRVCATSSDFKLKVLPGTTDEEAVDYFDEELNEIRELAGEIGSDVQKNEETRQQNEREREQGERERAQAESGRESAEQKRESQEGVRESQESTRENQESARKAAESQRESKEQERTETFALWESAESQRKEAEQSRDSAETARGDAEEKRQSQEQSRQTYYENLKSAVEQGDYDGATFTPSVSAEGDITWTNNRELPNPKKQNIKGPTGPPGPKGDIGEGLKILGVYNDLDALKADHETGERAGDAYMVAGHYYTWDGAEWADCGQFQTVSSISIAEIDALFAPE